MLRKIQHLAKMYIEMGQQMPPLVHFTYVFILGIIGSSIADHVGTGNYPRVIYFSIVFLFILGQTITFYAHKKPKSGGNRPNSGEAIPVDDSEQDQPLDANNLSRT